MIFQQVSSCKGIIRISIYWGGAAIAAAVARVFSVSYQKIRILVNFALVCLVVLLNASVSVPRLSIRGPDGVLLQQNVKLSVFLCVESQKSRSQLLSAAAQWKKAKSTQHSIESFKCLVELILSYIWSGISCSCPLVCRARCLRHSLKFFNTVVARELRNFSPCLIGILVISLAFLCGLAILLIRAGVELNPGPDSAGHPDFPEFGIISQNCRGLTDCKKSCRLVRKLNSHKNKSVPVIACLQETHCINRFALDNLYSGSYLADDGERNQRGVAILIPDAFELCEHSISGMGRWAIAAIKLKSSNSSYKLVVATIYAPNCHNESNVMFQDFMHSLDACTELLVGQGHEFDVVINGDFNVVLDPTVGLLNRASTASERNLARAINNSLNDRGLVEVKASDSRLSLYTWRRGSCFSKLDYMFVSPYLGSNLTASAVTWHKFGANYHHPCFESQFRFTCKTDRGRSFPKLFYTDISTDKDKVWIKQQIELMLQQCLPHWDPHMKLDFVKNMLRSKTLELRLMNRYSSSSDSIKEKLNSLLTKPIFTRSDILAIEALRLDLAKAEEQEAELLSLKAGVKWREEGEKSTRYFLSRFKARSAAATMHVLNAGRNVISGTVDLANFVRIFYSNLYQSKITFIKDLNTRVKH